MSILLNQIGYIQGAKNLQKLAITTGSGKYCVVNSLGESVLQKEAEYFGEDPLSGDVLYRVDFSEVDKEDTYCLLGENGEKSYSFQIRKDVYKEVHNAMLKAFYFQRCGCALEEKYAGVYTHAACHTGISYELFNEDVSFDGTGGWHDAGDYGRYVTAGAVAVAHLLYAYKAYPQAFREEINIPESGNGTPDVLNECAYELRWLLKLQREDGGVYHKLTALRHARFVMPEEDLDTFYAYPVSDLATGDFCAIMALGYGVYEKYDKALAVAMADAAKKAWKWLVKHPEEILFKNPEGTATGEYGDRSAKDERLWAAVEMFYLAKALGEDTSEYALAAKNAIMEPLSLVNFGWGDVSGFASLAILEDAEKALGEDCYEKVKAAVLKEAERLEALSYENAYGLAMGPGDFCWGGCMVVTNRCILLSMAYELTGKEIYCQIIQRHMDYMLGMNGTDYSFVTGFGEHACKNLHNRPTASDGIEEPMPGWVAGGPCGVPRDGRAKELVPEGTPPMKCYVDHVDCYSMNEITIYWNSSAVYMSAFLRNR